MNKLITIYALTVIVASLGIEKSAMALVGGTTPPVISLPRYPATVSMVSSASRCTAAKVGSKTFLTAAHCVWDYATNSRMASYANGQKLSVTNVMYPYQSLGFVIWNQLTITNVIPNSAFLSGCTGPNCNHILMMEKGGDVALVQVAEETPFIATAAMEFGNVSSGTSVVMMGYGCEDGIGTHGVPGEPDLPWGRKKYHSTGVKDVGFVTGLGFPSPSGAFLGNHFFTAGNAFSPSEASLCPGDSGGPVILDNGNELSVIGVNSYYGAQNPLISWAISGYNTFARLTPIEAWLRANTL